MGKNARFFRVILLDEIQVIKPFKLQPSTAHTFTDQHLYQLLLAQPDRTTFTGLRNYVMMLTLLDTGIRLKELTNLHVTDVLLDEGSLRINLGKGRKSRLVPIEQTTTDEMKRYLLERGNLEHNALWVNLKQSALFVWRHSHDDCPLLPIGENLGHSMFLSYLSTYVCQEILIKWRRRLHAQKHNGACTNRDD